MTHPLDSLEVYVWEAASSIAQRVETLLSDTEALVLRADGIDGETSLTPSRVAVAVVSVTAVSGRTAGPHAREWLTRSGLPVIWVAAHARETAPGYFPPEYANILPPDFSGIELRSLLERLVGRVAKEANKVARARPLVAESALMKEVLRETQAYADCNANVLVHGQTGVGKEHIAILLHEGNRHYGRGPFVVVNCGAIPDGLFESHFFGHAKGAFTGAVGMHKGYFEQANGGTLFLDEIGDLPAHQQVKLLRVLESSVITRLGSTAEIRVDFRLVVATHRDLRAMVEAGTFRADLYYRMAVIEIVIPSLDERGPQDKVAIFQALLSDLLVSEGQPLDIPAWLLERIGCTHFAGNVRELRNVAERIAVVRRQFGSWDEARLNRVLERLQPAASTGAAVSAETGGLSARDALERERVLAALRANGWRRQDSAAYLGISRKVLWEKMRKLQIETPTAESPHKADSVFY